MREKKEKEEQDRVNKNNKPDPFKAKEFKSNKPVEMAKGGSVKNDPFKAKEFISAKPLELSKAKSVQNDPFMAREFKSKNPDLPPKKEESKSNAPPLSNEPKNTRLFIIRGVVVMAPFVKNSQIFFPS